MEKKFELSEKVRKELEQNTEEAKKTLEGKEKEIQDMKDGLRQGKEVAVRDVPWLWRPAVRARRLIPSMVRQHPLSSQEGLP